MAKRWDFVSCCGKLGQELREPNRVNRLGFFNFRGHPRIGNYQFPEGDFMFQLSEDEFSGLTRKIESPNLRSQIATSSWGGRRYLPYVFTEQGVAMLSSVLRSKRAIHVNVEIMRAFVRLRRMLASNEELARKLAALERKYDAQFKAVFDAIRQLMKPPEPNKRKIGFLVKEKAARYGRAYSCHFDVLRILKT